ncbi:MAG: hypothetical protein DSZ08_05595 [Sulfurovum sp.]|nr:MAG: hypothetical protein DSZ08_05595 [Sulfurovum sp.]
MSKVNNKKVQVVIDDMEAMNKEIKTKVEAQDAKITQDFSKIEDSFSKLKAKFKEILNDGKDANKEIVSKVELGLADAKDDIRTTIAQAADEIKDAYKEIKKKI